MRPGPTHLRLCEALPDEGDEAAPAALDFETVFRGYGRYVAAVALRILGRDDDIDDLVQEVFLSAIKGLGAVRDADALRGWLRTITVRKARDRLRHRRFWSFLGMGLGIGCDSARAYDEIAAPGSSGEQRALLARVYRLLDELPVEQRLAWTLRHVEGEPLEEVARLCACSLATAKRRIASAHQAIERMLGHE